MSDSMSLTNTSATQIAVPQTVTQIAVPQTWNEFNRLAGETEFAYRAVASRATGIFSPLLLLPVLRRLDDIEDKIRKLERMVEDLRSKREDLPSKGGGGPGGPGGDPDSWWKKFFRLAKELLVEIAEALAEIGRKIGRLVPPQLRKFGFPSGKQLERSSRR